jgi:hypothetical protein
MDALNIAQLKDRILNYLFEHYNERILLSVIYQDLNLNSENILIEVVDDCMEDMVLDKVIYRLQMSGGRNLYYIAESGKIRLREGGYKKLLKIELEKVEQHNEDDQKPKEKTDLEIKNLQASLKHYKHTRRISIWAIIISIASLIISILLRLY